MLKLLIFGFLLIHAHAATTHKHQHGGSKERLQDGSYVPRDAHHHEGGVHHSEFDHEAILGSVKEAEEFDNLSPQESKRRLAILVEKMDRNSDRFVDRHELKAWILRSFRSLAQEEAAERFEDCDEDGNNQLTWSEYLQDTYGMDTDEENERIGAEGFEDSQDKLIVDDKELFHAADVNGDGVLDVEEFSRFNNPEEYPELLPIILNQTLKDKDANGDRKIDFQEFIGDSAQDKDKEYLLTEKDRFDHDYDKNRDGFLEGNEILSWMLPSNTEVAEEEVDHLFAGADDDHDDRLGYDEIIANYDLFVGSEATDYGNHLNEDNLKHFKDEL